METEFKTHVANLDLNWFEFLPKIGRYSLKFEMFSKFKLTGPEAASGTTLTYKCLVRQL